MRVLIAANNYADAAFWREEARRLLPDEPEIRTTTFRRGPQALRGHVWDQVYIVGGPDRTALDADVRDAFLRDLVSHALFYGTTILPQADLEELPA